MKTEGKHGHHTLNQLKTICKFYCEILTIYRSYKKLFFDTHLNLMECSHKITKAAMLICQKNFFLMVNNHFLLLCFFKSHLFTYQKNIFFKKHLFVIWIQWWNVYLSRIHLFQMINLVLLRIVEICSMKTSLSLFKKIQWHKPFLSYDCFILNRLTGWYLEKGDFMLKMISASDFTQWKHLHSSPLQFHSGLVCLTDDGSTSVKVMALYQ